MVRVETYSARRSAFSFSKRLCSSAGSKYFSRYSGFKSSRMPEVFCRVANASWNPVNVICASCRTQAESMRWTIMYVHIRQKILLESSKTDWTVFFNIKHHWNGVISEFRFYHHIWKINNDHKNTFKNVSDVNCIDKKDTSIILHRQFLPARHALHTRASLKRQKSNIFSCLK